MSVSIRKEYSITENETGRLLELKKLESLGVIELEQRKVQLCKCGEAHRIDGLFSQDGRINCS